MPRGKGERVARVSLLPAPPGDVAVSWERCRRWRHEHSERRDFPEHKRRTISNAVGGSLRRPAPRPLLPVAASLHEQQGVVGRALDAWEKLQRMEAGDAFSTP